MLSGITSTLDADADSPRSLIDRRGHSTNVTGKTRHKEMII